MGVFFASLSALGFTLANIFIRKGLRPGDADNGVFVTLLLQVTIVTGGVIILAVAGALPKWNIIGFLWFVASGIVTSFLGRVTTFGAIRGIGSSRAASIKMTSPIVSIIGAVLFLGERLPPLVIAGTMASVFGLFLLVYEAFEQREARAEPAQTEDATKAALQAQIRAEGTPTKEARADHHIVPAIMTGTLLAILSAIFFGSGQVIRKIGLEYLPNAFLGSMISLWIALFSYLAMVTVQGQLRTVFQNSLGSFRPYFWLAGVGLTVGQLSVFAAIMFAPVSHVVIITAVETPLTLILAAIFLSRSETVGSKVVVAALAVFVGAILVALA